MPENEIEKTGGVTDVFGGGKGLAKLLDVIQKGVGRIFKKKFDRQDIDTEAYRRIELAKADADALKIRTNAIKEISDGTGGITYEQDGVQIKSIEENMPLLERAESRERYQSAKRQLNIEAVASIAVEQFTEAEQVSDVPVDEDWINRFFRIVEDVSNGEMQKLWGRILAGEVKSPKSFSLRTLEQVKVLTQADAKLIESISKHVVYLSTEHLFVPSDFACMKKNKIFHLDFVKLSEIGILHSVDTSLDFSKLVKDVDEKDEISIGNRKVIIHRVRKGTKLLMVTSFTTFGREVLQLLDTTPQSNFFEETVQFLTDAGFEVTNSSSQGF
jgi:hypothetical protein